MSIKKVSFAEEATIYTVPARDKKGKPAITDRVNTLSKTLPRATPQLSFPQGRTHRLLKKK